MHDIKSRIEEEIKKRRAIDKSINKTYIAKKIGYADVSGFYNALKRGSLKVGQFIEIAKILKVEPSELLPGSPKYDLFNMPLIDLIKAICKKEIKNYLNK